MKTSIKNYIKACEVCQQNKHENISSAGLLQPLPIPDRIWEDIFMDFIEGLPTSHHKTTIMVVVDRLTKYVYFFPYAILILLLWWPMSLLKEFSNFMECPNL